MAELKDTFFIVFCYWASETVTGKNVIRQRAIFF